MLLNNYYYYDYATINYDSNITHPVYNTVNTQHWAVVAFIPSH